MSVILALHGRHCVTSGISLTPSGLRFLISDSSQEGYGPCTSVSPFLKEEAEAWVIW